MAEAGYLAGPEVLPADPRSGVYARALQAAEVWSQHCQGIDDARLKEFREGRFGSNQGELVGANFRFPFVTMLLAYLMAQSPTPEVEAREAGGAGADVFGMLAGAGLFESEDAAREAFSDGLEQLLAHSYERTGSETYNKVALFRALVVGCGITKVGFDAELGLDRLDVVERQDLYCDPQAKFSLRESGYVIHTCAWDFERAAAFFKRLGIAIQPNYELRQATGLMGEAQKKFAPATEQPDMFRFAEVWCKHGSERKLYYFDAQTKTLLGEPLDWPFTLDREEFPFSLLTFNTQYLQALDGFSELEVTKKLRDQNEEGMAYQAKHIGRSRAKKIAYDTSKISPENVEHLKDPQDLRFVGIDAGGEDLSRFIRVIDFNSNTDSDLERVAIFKQAADEIDGQDELVRGAAGQVKMTATEAAVKDANSKLRTGRRVKLVDQFLTDQTVKRAMVARQLVSAETMAKVAGPQAGLVWSVFAPNPEDLVAGYSIGITAGSTGEMHKRDRIDRIDRFLDLGAKLNGAYGNMPVVRLHELVKDRQKIEGFRRIKKYINEDLLTQLEQQALMPAPMPGPGGQPVPEQAQPVPPEAAGVPA